MRSTTRIDVQHRNVSLASLVEVNLDTTKMQFSLKYSVGMVVLTLAAVSGGSLRRG